MLRTNTAPIVHMTGLLLQSSPPSPYQSKPVTGRAAKQPKVSPDDSQTLAISLSPLFEDSVDMADDALCPAGSAGRSADHELDLGQLSTELLHETLAHQEIQECPVSLLWNCCGSLGLQEFPNSPSSHRSALSFGSSVGSGAVSTTLDVLP